MDKRRAPRYAISLDALVHPASGRSWLCEIKDFCSGGMLLVEQEDSRIRRSMTGAAAGEQVGIHFTVPMDSGDKHFRLEGTIVRVLESGVGISFAGGLEDEAMRCLLDHSNRSMLNPDLEVQIAEEERGNEEDDRPRRRSRKAAARSSGESAARGREAATGTGGKAGAGSAAKDRAARQRSAARGTGAAGAKRSEAAATDARDGRPARARAGAVQGSRGISPKQAKEIVAACRKMVVSALPEMNAALFDYMDNELLLLARDATSNAVQSEYFAAMSTLEKAKKKVGQSFFNDVLNQIDEPMDVETLLEKRRQLEIERKSQQEKTRRRLTLVNAEEFEDWLAVANIVSKSERMYSKYLMEIQARMGMLVESWSHNEVNPFGPAVFCRAFDDAMRDVDLTKEVRQKIYNGFEATVIPLFRKLYISITDHLEESQLFPDLDDEYMDSGPVTTAAAQPEEAPADEHAAETEEEDKESEKDESAADAFDEEEDEEEEKEEEEEPARLRPAPRRRVRRPSERSRSGRRVMRPQRRGAGRRRRSEVDQALESIYGTISSLLNREPDDAPEYDEEDLYYEDQIHDILNIVQEDPRESGIRVPVKEKILETLKLSGGEGTWHQIAPPTRQGLEVVQNIVDTIEDDHMVSSGAKDWVRDLEITLNKVALEKGDLLDPERPHEAMEVLNQLATLGASESGSVKRKVDKIVRDIVDNYDTNDRAFKDASQQLQPLIERQNRAFTGNVQRAVKASQGQQVLADAQKAVVREMDSRLAGTSIPEVLLRLLVPGWRNLLVNTHLRQGEDSADWQRYLGLLDQLIGHVDGSQDVVEREDFLEPDALLEEIETGLESIAYEPGQRTPLIHALESIITDEGDGARQETVPMPEAGVAEAIGLGQIEQQQRRRDQLRRELGTQPEWERWHDRVSRLHIGEWLELNNEAGVGQIAIVTWVSEDGETYVFVNRRGIKTHELSIEELIQKLMSGDAKILEEAEIPLTDRASHKMLQDMHNRLTHQATHDELTGLTNRKEFEKALDSAIRDAAARETSYVVAYMDLDQFKVINTTCGYEAGDELLVNISRLLSDSLTTTPHMLSRLGGDEYGVLLPNCDAERGRDIVADLCAKIRDYRFDWRGSRFNLTASAGLVLIDRDVKNISSILRTVDAACFAAKEAGRDRVQLYERDNTDLVHRHGVMEFVAQIDSALAQDRFVLNCQKISPIRDGLDHYEILLTVLDEDGEPLPPQDFIIAAETYNRMSAIDRWVIRNAFQFIAGNILKLEGLGPFSINVSGSSLTESDFMEFVLEQFNETRLPTSKICFEITETSAISSLGDAIEFMEKMKVIGVKFSLDDFGTGLSSYSYLRNLPVDFLKIDGIFVKDIENNKEDYAVVKSISEIGHFMGKEVIAEYVESERALQILDEIGVDYAQGFGIGKKIPLQELI